MKLTLRQQLAQFGHILQNQLFPILEQDCGEMDATSKRLVATLEMLPLGLMNGKVIVATEDPSRRDRIDEAEFLAQTKIAPVLPAGPNLADQIPMIYGRVGLNEASSPLNFTFQPVPQSLAMMVKP